MTTQTQELLTREHAAPTGPRRLIALDGLRGVAILMVLWFHYYGAVKLLPDRPMDSVIVRTIDTGWTGVNLFFVLSGFLITGILLDAKGTDHYFRNFYARRSLRIFPLYYGFLLLMIVLIPLVHPYKNPPAQSQAWLWFYGTNIAMTFFHNSLDGFTPMWSLAVEEHFYLLWPAVVLLLSRRRLFQVCLGICGMSLALRLIFLLKGIWPANFTLCRADDLAMGALLSVVARWPRGVQPYVRIAKIAPLVCLIPLAYLFGTSKPVDGMTPAMLGGGLTLIGIVMTCIVLLAVSENPPSWMTQLLSARWLRSFGKYSYAIYIFHWTLIPLIYKAFIRLHLELNAPSRFVSQLPFAIVSTAVCWVLAFLSWHLFEKHFLKLKRFFEYGKAAAV